MANDGSRPPKILLVDDSAEMLDLFEVYLAGEGFDLTTTQSGDEALLAARRTKPDLIILDVLMPGMDGYEVCEKLQQQEALAYIPIIFATAMGQEEDRTRAFAVGAADHIGKPIVKQELIAIVHKHLKTNAQWSEAREAPQLDTTQVRSTESTFGQFKAQLARDAGLTTDQTEVLRRATPKTMWSAFRAAGIKKAGLAERMAEFLGFPYVALVSSDQVALGVLPPAFCRANSVVPINRRGGGAAFALSNPFDVEMLESLKLASAVDSPEFLVTESEAIARLFDADAKKTAVPTAPTPEIEMDSELDVVGDPLETSASPEGSTGGLPVVRLVNEILVHALEVGASDIHIEPREDDLAVRYRQDGVLRESSPISKAMAAPIISRLKILAKMDIAERRLPQDGHMRLQTAGRSVDLRVSTLPIKHGEKIVLRVLDRATVTLDFVALGLDHEAIEAIQECTHQPNGIVLITGPTGSGKTTTLYTALQDVNTPGTNIVTVEDPVEYELHRVNQVEVNAEVGLTFPVVLRAVLRQDPDIILIGEIRDRETTDIAVKAALSGHLVMSTLHTNDAPSSIARLVDMGVEPFLLAASTRMIAAQRLLRTLCGHCKSSVADDREARSRLNIEDRPGDQFCRANGCKHIAVKPAIKVGRRSSR